jgi:pilus assembly protein CpaC
VYSSKLNIGATLQDLASMNIAQILAEPVITTMSGQKANFLAGGEFPFPIVQGELGWDDRPEGGPRGKRAGLQ